MSVREPEVLDRGQDGSEPSRRPIVAGAAGGLWSLLVGVALVSCLVMLAWAISPNSAGDSVAAWRASGYTWLGAHQVPLELGGRQLTLLPLGALLLGVLLTRRAGRWAGRLLSAPSAGEAVGIVAACALVYGAGGAGVAWLSGSPATGAEPAQALLFTGAAAVVGATWGIAGEADLVGRARARTSDGVWRTLVAALAAVIGLLAAGAALVTVSLVRNLGQVGATMADLDGGLVGALALTLVGILALPTLDIWALSVIVGPGFDLGAGNGLDLLGGEVEILPALPVLAAVPAGMPPWSPVLLLVPLAMGVLAGRIRWGRDLPTPAGVAASGLGLAAAVAALVAGLGVLASGSLGGGRLAEVGPAPALTGAAAAGLVLLGFLIEAGVQALHLHWVLHRRQGPDPGSPARGPRSTATGGHAPAGPTEEELGEATSIAAGAVTPEPERDEAPPKEAPVSAAGALRRAGRRVRHSVTIPVPIPHGPSTEEPPAATGSSTGKVAASADPDVAEDASGGCPAEDAAEGHTTVDLTVSATALAAMRAAEGSSATPSPGPDAEQPRS